MVEVEIMIPKCGSHFRPALAIRACFVIWLLSGVTSKANGNRLATAEKPVLTYGCPYIDIYCNLATSRNSSNPVWGDQVEPLVIESIETAKELIETIRNISKTFVNSRCFNSIDDFILFYREYKASRLYPKQFYDQYSLTYRSSDIYVYQGISLMDIISSRLGFKYPKMSSSMYSVAVDMFASERVLQSYEQDKNKTPRIKSFYHIMACLKISISGTRLGHILMDPTVDPEPIVIMDDAKEPHTGVQGSGKNAVEFVTLSTNKNYAYTRRNQTHIRNIPMVIYLTHPYCSIVDFTQKPSLLQPYRTISKRNEKGSIETATYFHTTEIKVLVDDWGKVINNAHLTVYIRDPPYNYQMINTKVDFFDLTTSEGPELTALDTANEIMNLKPRELILTLLDANEALQDIRFLDAIKDIAMRLGPEVHVIYYPNLQTQPLYRTIATQDGTLIKGGVLNQVNIDANLMYRIRIVPQKTPRPVFKYGCPFIDDKYNVKDNFEAGPMWGSKVEPLVIENNAKLNELLQQLTSIIQEFYEHYLSNSVDDLVAFHKAYECEGRTLVENFYVKYKPKYISGQIFAFQGLALLDLITEKLEGQYPTISRHMYSASIHAVPHSLLQSLQQQGTTPLKAIMYQTLACLRISLPQRPGYILLGPNRELLRIKYPIVVMEDGADPHTGVQQYKNRTVELVTLPTNKNYIIVRKSATNDSTAILINVTNAYCSVIEFTEKPSLLLPFRTLYKQDEQGTIEAEIYFNAIGKFGNTRRGQRVNKAPLTLYLKDPPSSMKREYVISFERMNYQNLSQVLSAEEIKAINTANNIMRLRPYELLRRLQLITTVMQDADFLQEIANIYRRMKSGTYSPSRRGWATLIFPPEVLKSQK